jgi:hypothetical protein
VPLPAGANVGLLEGRYVVLSVASGSAQVPADCSPEESGSCVEQISLGSEFRGTALVSTKFKARGETCLTP